MVKKWKFRGGGGTLHEIPSVVGAWIFSGTTQFDRPETVGDRAKMNLAGHRVGKLF